MTAAVKRSPMPPRKKPLSRGPMKRPLSEKFLASQRANSAKRIYVKTGEMIPCAVCGKEFYATPLQISRKRRFCSQKCMGQDFRKLRKCSVCFSFFESKYPRKTCSTACRNLAISRGKLGARNPNYKAGERERKGVWHASRKRFCEVCQKATGRMELHHVVYEQHVRRAKGDEFDVRNGLTLCRGCHARHHLADKHVPRSALRSEHLEFARELLGARAADYLERHYPEQP